MRKREKYRHHYNVQRVSQINPPEGKMKEEVYCRTRHWIKWPISDKTAPTRLAGYSAGYSAICNALS
jgi:hypothetical protein